MEDYLIPTGEAVFELTEKKSRFIAHIFRTETEEEAVAALKKMRETYWDARHNVYAYIIRGGQTRYSDDGEPGGTAGMPVLEALRHAELNQVCCVVTRYFGGTLLGTGGLVRAYGTAASKAVEAAGTSRRCLWESLEIPIPYAMFEQVKREISQAGGSIQDTVYGSGITLRAIFPVEKTEGFRIRLRDISSGKLEAISAGTEYRDFPVENMQSVHL